MGSVNLRFNPNNERHRNAEEIMKLVGPRDKTAFAVLAIEAYMQLHPYGVNMNELREVRRETWNNKPATRISGSPPTPQSVKSDIPQPPASPEPVPLKEKQPDALKKARAFYSIK